MVAWTTPRTWTNNETVTDTILNAHVRDNLNAIANPPYVHVRAASTTTTLGNATATPIVWDTEVADTDNLYSTSANTRVTVNTAGLYLCQGAYGVASGAVGNHFYVQWMVNGAAINQAGSSVGIGNTLARSILVSTSTYVRLYANDYVSLAGSFVGTGTPTTRVDIGAYTSWMQLRWMGP
jgi:hypothetical protein